MVNYTSLKKADICILNNSKNAPVSAAEVFTDPIHFLAFGFGSGLAPFAPGTFGTLAAIPVFLLLSSFSLVAYVVITLLLFFAGVWLCGQSAEKLGVHDHGGIVWDEIVGLLITLIAVPVSWKWVLAGFALFRFFDVVKPWPIRWLDRQVTGGLGIMLDDVLAGVYAWIVLQCLLLWLS